MGRWLTVCLGLLVGGCATDNPLFGLGSDTADSEATLDDGLEPGGVGTGTTGADTGVVTTLPDDDDNTTTPDDVDPSASTGLPPDDGSDDTQGTDPSSCDAPDVDIGLRAVEDTFVVSDVSPACPDTLCGGRNYGNTASHPVHELDGTGYLLARFDLSEQNLSVLSETVLIVRMGSSEPPGAVTLSAWAITDPTWVAGDNFASLAHMGEATWEHAALPDPWTEGKAEFPGALGAMLGETQSDGLTKGVDIVIDLDAVAVGAAVDGGMAGIAVTVTEGAAVDLLTGEADPEAVRLHVVGCSDA